MASGRCAGCHKTGSLRTIDTHVNTCEPYLALYRTDPANCPTPAEEYRRHRTEDATPEARALAREQRLTRRFAELNRHQAASTVRWATPPDILE